MKQPDEPAIGGARKSLPSRKSRKPQQGTASAQSKQVEKPQRKENILDKDVEKELVKVFGQK